MSTERHNYANASASNLEIAKSYLILCEGRDDWGFMVNFLNSDPMKKLDERASRDIQVIYYDGVDNLGRVLVAIKSASRIPDGEGIDPGFKTLLVIRDADDDSKAATQSVKDALKKAKYILPDRPAVWAGDDTKEPSKVGFLIFPSCSENLRNGTIEDLCFELIKGKEQNKRLFGEAVKYVAAADDIAELTHKHKNTLHAYFAGTNDFVGQKLGEAAKSGAFDWSSELLKPLAEFIREGF